MTIPSGSRYVAMGSSFAAAETAGLEYVGVSAASADHHAWSAVPWTRRFHLSLRGGAPYHPNVPGMAAVAELVIEALT